MNDVKAGWLKWRRPLAAAAVCGMLAIGLQGCFGVLAGGMLAGTFAATDRRTLGAQTEDKSIVVKGEANIPGVVASGSHVNVTSFNRKVLLSGEVPDEASKAAAEREIKSLPNVSGVFNELVISGSSGFSARSGDALITSKVLDIDKGLWFLVDIRIGDFSNNKNAKIKGTNSLDTRGTPGV